MKILLFSTLLMLICSCADFTDIEPKGKNLLEKISDIDQLLNYQYNYINSPEVPILTGDRMPENAVNLISDPVKTLEAVLLTWDEQTDRAALTVSDAKYDAFYGIIGQVANAVLLMIDDAEGDRITALRLKAEAYVLRAWFHYLAVNLYAKAYHPATASTDAGVAYSTEKHSVTQPLPKSSVQEVYNNILADIQAALVLNSLPNTPQNLMRVSKAFAYAVEAEVYMSLRQYESAMEAANKSLEIQNTIDDYSDNLTEGFDLEGNEGEFFDRPEIQSPEDLFYASDNNFVFYGFSPSLSAAFEPGDIFFNHVVKFPSEAAAMFYGFPIDVGFSSTVFFNNLGLTTIDMYLVKAECLIRAGNDNEAMGIINAIRRCRIDTEYYAPLTGVDAFSALKNLSHTENFYSIRHFINLKRWNTEDAYRETIHKTLQGVNYELRSESPLWIFPFPQNATANNPYLTQNYE
ncbi:MAG: RagB/SusD family nutrient uptake outer membrane protein [Dysgonamonadaceae bacterium]|jgi:tetratricopeptide (TPR) repeat protein|nr:RagB/SusD family nutrient uptake outer membrane protein [Dysgonamonadaceae bacterium]